MESTDGSARVFFTHEDNITAECRVRPHLVIGDAGDNVLFLVLNETDGFWEVANGTPHSEEEGGSGHPRGRVARFRSLLIRGFDGVISVVKMTSRVQTQTVEELLEELGPQFRNPDRVKDAGDTEVPVTTRIKELKDGTTLTLFFIIRGGGMSGMPPKGGQQHSVAQRNEFLTNMGKLHHQTRQEEVDRLREQDLEVGKAMGVGNAERQELVRRVAAERKLGAEQENQQSATERARKDDQMMERLTHMTIAAKDMVLRFKGKESSLQRFLRQPGEVCDNETSLLTLGMLV